VWRMLVARYYDDCYVGPTVMRYGEDCVEL